jgi:tetratricopeptide (TPR) repeat protein
MRTRLAAVAAHAAESGWLIAAAVVPLYFNILTVRVFEEEKVPLLRSIALAIAAAICIWIAEQGSKAWRRDAQAVWRLPLVRPALTLTAIYLFATAFSIAPSRSFWGAYIRAQGSYTWLSYIVVFFAVVLLLRRREQVDRLVTVVLLGSLPAALYGVLQHLGRDPIAWAGMATDRVSSTAGNPIFIGASLIMVVPLTLARIFEQGAAMRRTPTGGNRAAAMTLLLAYLVLLLLQLLTIAYSQSRGPFIGLGVGMAYFFVVYSLQRRLRRLSLAIVALVAAAAVWLALFNLPDSPLQRWRQVPYVGRLGEISDVGSGTGKVRALIWEGATALLAADPLRAAVGYGPETLFLAYARVYPPELAHYESRGAAPDRSHNETFDALITIGVAGLIAQLAVFLSFFLHVLQWLGLINGAGQRRAFLLIVLLGGASGIGVPWAVDGSLRFAGVAVPAGIAGAGLVYLIGVALLPLAAGRSDRPFPSTHAFDRVSRKPRAAAPEQPGDTQCWQRDDLLLIALLAAVMAHFIEIHVGIAIAATRLFFWLYAAVAVAIGVPLLRDEAAAGATSPGRQRFSSYGDLVTLGPIVGLVLVTLTVGFYRPGLGPHLPALAVLAGAVWFMGALLIAAEPGAPRDRAARLGAYAATTLGIWLLFSAVYAPRIAWTPVVSELRPEIVRFIGWRRAHGVSIFYCFTFLTLAIIAAGRTWREWPAARPLSRSPWLAAWYPLVIGAAAVAVVTTNLRSSWADTFAKQGAFYEGQGQWMAAATVYEEALRLRPWEDRYATNLGRAYMELARRDLRDRPTERDAALARGLQAMQRARALSPLDTDHPRNLAKAHRTWAALSEGETRAQHVRQANAYYQEAVRLSPNTATLWSEWATMYLEQRDPQRALEILDRSLQIDDRYPTTYWLRAQAHQAAGEWEAADADYDRALAIDPRLLSAWSGKALVLAHLGRADEAIRATHEALALAPNDPISHRNLALLYRQTGQLAPALVEARTALALAPPADKPPLETLITELAATTATAGE